MTIFYNDFKIASGHELIPDEVVHEVRVVKSVITYVVKEFSPADSPTVVTSDGIKQKSLLRLNVNRFRQFGNGPDAVWVCLVKNQNNQINQGNQNSNIIYFS
jgi:hypothetical protein